MTTLSQCFTINTPPHVLSRVILCQFPGEALPDPICSSMLWLSALTVVMSQVTRKQHEEWWTLSWGRIERGWRERRGSELNHSFFKWFKLHWPLLNLFLKEDSEFAKDRRGATFGAWTGEENDLERIRLLKSLEIHWRNLDYLPASTYRSLALPTSNSSLALSMHSLHLLTSDVSWDAEDGHSLTSAVTWNIPPSFSPPAYPLPQKAKPMINQAGQVSPSGCTWTRLKPSQPCRSVPETSHIICHN